MHDAGAALAGVAADMGAGEAELFAQELDQQGARLEVAVTALPFTVRVTVAIDFTPSMRCRRPLPAARSAEAPPGRRGAG